MIYLLLEGVYCVLVRKVEELDLRRIRQRIKTILTVKPVPAFDH